MMKKLLRQIINGQQGQALPVVLALLMLGGLMITPSLNYAATSLNHGRTIDRNTDGIYAADAGIEYALWSLINSASPPSQLAGAINGMSVSLQTVDNGAYTVYFGELVQAGSHSQDIGVDGDIEWDSGAGAWKYTITVTRYGGSTTIHITSVGARLPDDYSYQAGSAALFGGNLSTAEPAIVLDSSGAYMLNWEFSTPYPSVTQSNPVKTQTFYINGTGEQTGEYTWVVANRQDIGEVGEMTGDLYILTATATRDGAVTARIKADVLMVSGVPSIVSWQISK